MLKIARKPLKENNEGKPGLSILKQIVEVTKSWGHIHRQTDVME